MRVVFWTRLAKFLLPHRTLPWSTVVQFSRKRLLIFSKRSQVLKARSTVLLRLSVHQSYCEISIILYTLYRAEHRIIPPYFSQHRIYCAYSARRRLHLLLLLFFSLIIDNPYLVVIGRRWLAHFHEINEHGLGGNLHDCRLLAAAEMLVPWDSENEFLAWWCASQRGRRAHLVMHWKFIELKFAKLIMSEYFNTHLARLRLLATHARSALLVALKS